MKSRLSQFTLMTVYLAGSGACFAAPSYLANVRAFYPSGPVALSAGQTANVCAANLDDSPISVLIVVLTADTGTLLTSNQQVLQPGMGTCAGYNRSPNAANLGPNVVGLVIPNGHIQTNGSIVQIGPGGGGCIVASLQIQTATLNNIPAQTILYVPMPQRIYEENGNRN